MALTLEQIRSIPGYEEMSDDDIVKHGESIGMQIADAPKPPDEAGALRSYVGIPLLKGTADIGSTVGYGLEAVGAKAAGRALQDSGQQLQETLTQRQSKQAQEDAKKTLIDENGHYGGYNLGTLVQDVATSAPGTLAMGMAGAPLAKGVTAASKAIGLGEKAARIAGTGSLGRALAAGLDTVAGNAVGFGAAEGAYSGASNAAQLQHEIRNADINKLSEHPAFVDAYHQNTDPALTPEERLYQAREVIAEKAADDVFADTFVKTGGISALTGGGVFGMVRDNVVKKAAGEATEGFIKSAGKGFLKEGLLQEAPQSGLEQRTINQAKRDYTDQNQDLNAGVWNATGQGGIAGGVMGLAGGAGSNSQPTTGGQNGISTETSNPSSPDQTQQSEPGAPAMPDESVPFEPEQPSGQAGGLDSQGSIDVAANPHEAYQKRAALKKRLIDTRQALKTGEDPDGSLAQELAGIETEYSALDAGLIDWEQNSEEGKAHRKESLEIKKNAATGDTVIHPEYGEVQITNAGRTSAALSTLDGQPLGEAPYHALKGLKKPQPRTEYDDAIKAAADKHDVPVEFLKAVALQESGAKQFDENGKTVKPSTSSALGVMQIIPKWHPEFDAERLANDAEYNIDAGAQFLGELIKKHGGDLHKAAQSYYGSTDAAENSKYADSVLSRMGGTNPEAGSNERRAEQGAQQLPVSDIGRDSQGSRTETEGLRPGEGLSASSDNGAVDHPQIATTGDGAVTDEEKEKQVRISEGGQEISPQEDELSSAARPQSLETQTTAGAGNEATLQGGDQLADTASTTAAPVPDQMPAHDDQASESSAPGVFVATHELSDGTQVNHVDGNTYRDENGDEYQDDYAEKLQPASEPVGRNDRHEPTVPANAVGRNDGGVSQAEPTQAPTGKVADDSSINSVEGVNSAIDAAAHEAATSPLNDLPEPTLTQKEAGNYKKGHLKLHGFDIAIENPKGSKRSGTDPDGNKWSVDMAHHYGYIKRSTGADNEHIDVFVGDHHDSDKAYVVNQIDPKTGKFDEHKIMLGFENKAKAKVGYLKNYAKGWKGLGSITEVPVSELKAKIESGAIRKPIRNHTTEIPVAEYEQATKVSDVQGGRTGGESIPSTAQQPTGSQQWQNKNGKAAAKSADMPLNTGAAFVAPDIQQSNQEANRDQSTNQAEKETAAGESVTVIDDEIEKSTKTQAGGQNLAGDVGGLATETNAEIQNKVGGQVDGQQVNEPTEANNRIPAIQPDPQNPDTNPAQPVAPAAQENLAGKVAEPVAVNPIINTSEVDWVKAKLDEQGMRSGAPGYAKAVKATKAQYQADLDKALASAPFEVFAAHPSNKGLPEGVVRQAHEVLREEHGASSEQAEPVNKGGVKFSRSPATRQAYERRIDELFANPQSIDRKSLREIKMLDRGDVLDLVGHGNLPVYVHEAHAVDDGRYNHPLSAEQWKKIPEWLENPALVLERASDGHLTIIAPEKSADGKAIVIGLEPKAAENARSGLQERHLVLTAYPKDRGVLPINRDIESGHYKPLFVDQKKGPDFYRGSGLNYSSDAGKLRAWNKSLKIDRDLVKYRKAQETGGLPSKTDQPVSGSTVADVKSWLPKRVKRLLDTGKLKVVQSVNDLPAYLQERGTALYHAAWHGSPHNHDKFDSGKIGTGEGAQAFGYGHYFTDKKEIAEWYRDALKDFVALDGTKADTYRMTFPRSSIVAMFQNRMSAKLDESEARKQTAEWAKTEKQILGELSPDQIDDFVSRLSFGKGKLYQVELAPEQDEYLLWDKPLSEQSKNIQRKIGGMPKKTRLDVERRLSNFSTKDVTLFDDTVTGYDFYRALSQAEGSDVDASEMLHDLGVRGIKYLDSTSRSGERENYNYVIFSDDDISITAKYSQLNGVEALYDEKHDRMYLVADMLDQNNLSPVLNHELLHRAEAIDPQLKAAISRFEDQFDRSFKHAAAGRGSAIEKAAYQRVIEAGTPAEDQAAEYRAYLVTEYSKKPDSFGGMIKKAIQDFIAAIRAALIRSGLDMGFIKSLTPADLAAMSRYGVNVKQNAENGKGQSFKKDDSLKDGDNIKFSRTASGENGGNNNGGGEVDGDGYRQWLSDENKKRADTLIYNLQNRFIDLKRQMQKIVKQGGTFTENQDPYMAEELYHQRSASRMKDFHDNELLPILQGLHEKHISLEDFQKFLHARHAPSRNRVMAERNPNQEIIDQKLQEAEDALESLRKNPATPAKELQAALREANKWNRAKPFQGSEDERLSLSGMSDQDAKAYMDGLEPIVRKRMADLADKIDAINNKTLDLMVSYGMETPESIQALKDQWEHYVPLHRDEAHPENGNFGHPIGRGFSVRGSGLKTATGSNAEVTNILAHIASARDQMIRRGEKNRVSVMLANFIHANPDDSFAELGKVPIEDVLVNGLVESRPDPLYKNRDNVVLFRANGGDHAIVFNEHNPEAVRLALTWKNMDGIELSLAAKMAAKGTRWLASVNTQYNVIFGLVNLIRDTQGALLNLSSTPLAGKQRQVFGHLGGALSAIAGIERGWSGVDPQLKAMYERFNKAGGTTGYSQMFDGIKERNRSIEKDLANIGAGGFKKFGLATTKWLSDFNTVMENGTRLAAFMAGVEAGLSDAKAASIAKNITVNFNRKGAFTTNVGAFYAFFNAAMQGTARLAETLSGPAGRRIMVGGVMLGAATTLIGILAMGEDDWEDIPEFVRERSLIAPLPGGHYFAVPMPLGFHVLPNIGRKFVESAFGSKRVSTAQRFAQLIGSVGGALNPLGGSDVSQMIMPTVLDPALALWRNKDWTGRRIYQEDFNSLKPTPGFTRTKDTATVASKLAAEAINKATGGTNYKPGFWSPTPDQIDYVFGQLFGGSGREVMKAEQAAESLVTGEELPLYKVPLVGRFVGETEGGAVERAAYYDNVRRLNEHHAELEGLAGEEHGAQKRADYLQEYPEARLYELAKNTKKTIDGMKKRRELLTKRGQSTRQIDDQITVRMKALNDAVEAKMR
jgi:hypothetical protein